MIKGGRMMNKAEMAEVVKMITFAYPNATFPADKLDQWYAWLKNYDFEQIEQNVRQHILHSPFQPSIADIVKVAKENTSRRPLEEVKRAEDEATAWLERHGVFDDDE
jgi:Loader and inhibitor of phage G40P